MIERSRFQRTRCGVGKDTRHAADDDSDAEHHERGDSLGGEQVVALYENEKGERGDESPEDAASGSHALLTVLIFSRIQ